jgi:hypothetical protein
MSQLVITDISFCEVDNVLVCHILGGRSITRSISRTTTAIGRFSFGGVSASVGFSVSPEGYAAGLASALSIAISDIGNVSGGVTSGVAV